MARDELELGNVEPGTLPARRDVPEGFHPWSPSVLDQWELDRGCHTSQKDHECRG